MDGLWEGVPASPISAASTERTSPRPRAYSPPATSSSMPPKRHLIADPNDVSQPWKRNRTVFMSPDSCSLSGSGSIEFVETNPESQTMSPAQDYSSKEERRKALIMRLQAIERIKKDLSRHSLRPNEDAQPADEKPTSRVESPNDVQSVPSPTVAASLPPRSRRGRGHQRAKSLRSKRSTSPPKDVQVIVVDDDTSTSSSAKRGRGKSTHGRKSIAQQRNRANAVPTRSSTRVRRPRVFEAGQIDSKSDIRVPTPSCMTKCKRFQFCKKLTISLVRDPAASFFAAPVKELWPSEAIPRYFDIISTPMDLGTVKRNLDFSAYIVPDKVGSLPYLFDVEKYSHDMRLIFKNAMEYNSAGDMLYNSALAMLTDFDRKMRDELPDIPPVTPGKTAPKQRSGVKRTRKDKATSSSARHDSENSLSDSQSVILVTQATATSAGCVKSPQQHSQRKSESESEPIAETRKELQDRLNYLKRSRSAVLARTPVPKGSGYLSRAVLLYNVAISHSQKRKCADAITQNKVPPGKMVALIDMLRGAVTAEDDEEDFELEFDQLDNEMWRNVEAFLEQYVAGFKTIRQSTLGREFTAVEQVDDEIKDIQYKLRKMSISKREEESGDDDNDSVGRPRKDTSFFSGDAVDDSSSESESDSGSDSSDDSDSDEE